MRRSLEETAHRSRNIRWFVVVDEVAKRLAATQRCTVSELLEDLVLAKAKLVEKKAA